MRLTVENHSSHKDAPTAEIYKQVGIQLLHVCNRWPGASIIIKALNSQGFYLNLVDDLPEAPGALGYHDVDSQGRPFSKVAVNPSLQNGSDWLTGQYSVVSVVGHEAIETVGNPIVNLWCDRDQNSEVARELCDAVEASGYRHNGCDLTNFVLPSFFNAFGTAPFDYCGVLDAPFQTAAGGYQIVRSGGTESQEWGHQYPEWRKTVHTRIVVR